MTDILQAARSYYGLSDATVRKTKWFTDEGKMILCFEIVTEGEDFIGIVERMKALQQNIQPTNAPQIRVLDEFDAYGNPMSPRKVAHIDAPETEEPTTMDAVWMWANEVPDQLRPLAADYRQDAYGAQYLIPRSMLTEEQRQKAKESGK